MIIVQDGSILAKYDISKAVHLRCDVPLNNDLNFILSTAKKNQYVVRDVIFENDFSKKCFF